MDFIINNRNWKIIETDPEELLKWYNSENNGNASYVYGYCKYNSQTIVIDETLSEELKIRTLRHELMHCYIWNYGLYNVIDRAEEETICDVYADAVTIIEEIVSSWKENGIRFLNV